MAISAIKATSYLPVGTQNSSIAAKKTTKASWLSVATLASLLLSQTVSALPSKDWATKRFQLIRQATCKGMPFDIQSCQFEQILPTSSVAINCREMAYSYKEVKGHPLEEVITCQESYHGLFNDNGFLDGPGTEFWPNERMRYRGDWKNGLWDGQGTLYRTDGSIKYQGPWKRNKREGGDGTAFFSNDIKDYVGEWHDDEPHGHGTRFSLSGEMIFKGHYFNGKPQGYGTSYWNSEHPKYQGDWLEGKPHGEGTVFKKDGSLGYKGEWQEGLRHGNGTAWLDDGTSYIGEWLNDEQHGKGKLLNSNGKLIYTGQFFQGKKHGLGSAFFDNERLNYIGHWEQDAWDGHGILYNIDGQLIYEGHLSKGVYGAKLEALWENNKIIEGRLFSQGTTTYYKPDGTIELKDSEKNKESKPAVYNPWKLSSEEKVIGILMSLGAMLSGVLLGCYYVCKRRKWQKNAID